MNLRIPGPTPCPEEVLQSLAQPMINHRGPGFERLIQKVTNRLKQFFQTRNDLIILTASGTGAMEAAVVNTLSPGDKVLAVSIGLFGERFAAIAETYGAEVIRLDFPWGQPADPEAVRKALKKSPDIKAALITHNETSTGVTNDLAALSAVVKELDKLLVVDAISSIGSIDLPVDTWRCDVVISASQKGWMAPPGVAMVSISEEAWEFAARSRMPRFYWDLAKAKSSLEKGQTPWTPAISTLFALEKSLDLMAQEGLSNIVERHARVGKATRKGVQSLGLSLLAQEQWASNTITAVQIPQGVDAKRLLDTLREDHKVILAGGYGNLAGKIIRIGHLGFVTEEDIQQVVEALRASLLKLEFKTSHLTDVRGS